MNGSNKEANRAMKEHVAVLSIISLILVPVVLLVFRYFNPSILPNDNVTLVLLFVAFVPAVSILISTIEFPGGWKITFQRLKQELDETRRLLDSIVVRSLGSEALNHLKKM